MDYPVTYVDDELMPQGQSWVICKRGPAPTLYLRRSMPTLPEAERAGILSEAWQGWMAMLEDAVQDSSATAAA